MSYEANWAAMPITDCAECHADDCSARRAAESLFAPVLAPDMLSMWRRLLCCRAVDGLAPCAGANEKHRATCVAQHGTVWSHLPIASAICSRCCGLGCGEATCYISLAVEGGEQKHSTFRRSLVNNSVCTPPGRRWSIEPSRDVFAWDLRCDGRGRHALGGGLVAPSRRIGAL